MVGGGVDDLLDAVHVGGEGRDDDLAGRLAEHLIQDRADLALGRDESGHQRIRGIHHEQVDALLAHASEGPQVGEATIQGQLVHLKVARDEHLAGLRAHEDRERVGDRVGDGDELEIEGADGETVALGDDVQAGVREAMLAQLGGDEGQGKIGTVHRDVAAQLEQVGDGTDVVLVTVGEHQAHDVVHALLDPGEIGEDQVNAGLAFLGEEDAAVHDQKFSPVFQDVHVAANLAEASQRDHSQGAFFEGRGFAEILVQRLHSASLPRQSAFARIGGSPSRVGPLTLGGEGAEESRRRGRGRVAGTGRVAGAGTGGARGALRGTGRGAARRPRRR